MVKEKGINSVQYLGLEMVKETQMDLGKDLMKVRDSNLGLEMEKG